MSEREQQIDEMNAARPFGYAHRYPDGFIRFGTGGREINGSKPTEVIALYSAEQVNRAVQEALAAPPTSEWNEAIEAAARACEKLAFPIAPTYEMGQGCRACAESIRALKRKEQP